MKVVEGEYRPVLQWLVQAHMVSVFVSNLVIGKKKKGLG